jgi:hypothetical protein
VRASFLALKREEIVFALFSAPEDSLLKIFMEYRSADFASLPSYFT